MSRDIMTRTATPAENGCPSSQLSAAALVDFTGVGTRFLPHRHSS